MNLKYFKDEEFKAAVPPCSLDQMDEQFMQLLDSAREIAGIPFIVNSAFRDPSYEKKRGRTGTSQHCFGRAVDLRCYTNDDRFRILSALIAVGFRRIGIDSRFIHVDSGYPSAHPLIWLY